MDPAKQHDLSKSLLGLLKDPSLFVQSGLIDGIERNGAAGRTFPVTEPSSGEILAHCADLSKDDIIDAVNVAEQGFSTFFETTSAKERGVILKEFHRLIVSNVDDCKRLFAFLNESPVVD